MIFDSIISMSIHKVEDVEFEYKLVLFIYDKSLPFRQSDIWAP